MVYFEKKNLTHKTSIIQNLCVKDKNDKRANFVYTIDFNNNEIIIDFIPHRNNYLDQSN